MKYLIATMMIMLLLVLSYNATADHQETTDYKRTWGIGDPISTAVICKDEDSIIKMINADMISVEDVLIQLNDLVDEGDCVSLERPAFFFVQSQLIEYMDFLDRPSIALGVESPYMKGKFLGFVLAPGFWGGEKNIKDTSI